MSFTRPNMNKRKLKMIAKLRRPVKRAFFIGEIWSLNRFIKQITRDCKKYDLTNMDKDVIKIADTAPSVEPLLLDRPIDDEN